MADTDSIPILCIQAFIMHLLAKQRLQCCLLGVRMASNQLFRGLFPFHYTILVLLTIFFEKIHDLSYITSAMLKCN